MASRRGYLTQAELAEYADITINNTTEADDQISQVEEMIDSYVGSQQSFLHSQVRGLASAGTSTTLTLEVDYQTYDQDYFKGCEIEIMGGTGEGQRRIISANTYNTGVITVVAAWASTPNNTSFYRIYQLGKFPRHCDSEFYNRTGTPRVFKSIPEAVKRATAAQLEYVIKMGQDFFTSNKFEMRREQIGDYEYEKNGTAGGQESLIAPKAKLLLKGLKNRTGYFVE